MKYNLTTPCDQCPFLQSNACFCTMRRLAEFASGPFPCHKTAILSEAEDEAGSQFIAGLNSSHCAGALIFQVVSGQLNQTSRIAERLGMFRPVDLKIDAPIRTPEDPDDGWEDEDE